MGKSTISTGPFSIAFCMFTRPGKCLFFQSVRSRYSASAHVDAALHHEPDAKAMPCKERPGMAAMADVTRFLGWGGVVDGIPRSHRNRSPVFVVLLSHCHVFSFFFFSVCSLFTPYTSYVFLLYILKPLRSFRFSIPERFYFRRVK